MEENVIFGPVYSGLKYVFCSKFDCRYWSRGAANHADYTEDLRKSLHCVRVIVVRIGLDIYPAVLTPGFKVAQGL